jgi:hypothetical protein
MGRYDQWSDDFYVNLHLNTEMELSRSRETVLHFFEQVQKHYPTMRNFYTRDEGDYVLEGDKEQGTYRWASIESRRVCSGYVNPDNIDDAMRQHRVVLEMVPYNLSISPLDCESLNLMYGFDYTYRGNHSELVMEALGVLPAFERIAQMPGATLLGNEPSIQMALDPECRWQFRLSFEARTGAFQVRTGEYPEEQLSVYLTVRRFGSLTKGETYVAALGRLGEIAAELMDGYIVEQVLQPLRQAIATK